MLIIKRGLIALQAVSNHSARKQQSDLSPTGNPGSFGVFVLSGARGRDDERGHNANVVGVSLALIALAMCPAIAITTTITGTPIYPHRNYSEARVRYESCNCTISVIWATVPACARQ